MKSFDSYIRNVGSYKQKNISNRIRLDFNLIHDIRIAR